MNIYSHSTQISRKPCFCFTIVLQRNFLFFCNHWFVHFQPNHFFLWLWEMNENRHRWRVLAPDQHLEKASIYASLLNWLHGCQKITDQNSWRFASFWRSKKVMPCMKCQFNLELANFKFSVRSSHIEDSSTKDSLTFSGFGRLKLVKHKKGPCGGPTELIGEGFTRWHVSS